MKPEKASDALVPPELLPWLHDKDIHAKIAQGLESLRQGKGLDGEAVMADLIAELDASENGR